MPPATPSMCALIFDAPARDTSTTRVGELPVPQPAAGQVSIDVSHAGVNFKDVMARRGDRGYVARWPFVPGLEVAGTVRAVGDGVSGFSPGQAVVAFTGEGGLAEVAVVDAERLVLIPPGLDPARAAAAPGALLTAELLLGEFGRLRTGETLLVHSAAGGVGQAVARLARVAGAGQLIGTVSRPDSAVIATRNGYDSALLRDSDLALRIDAATDGHGVDLILDAHGTALLDLDLQVLSPAGRIVLFGNATGSPPDQLPALPRLMAENATLTGFSLSALAATAPTLLRAALIRVLERLVGGELDVELRTLRGLAEAPQAHQALAEGRGHGKYVIAIA